MRPTGRNPSGEERLLAAALRFANRKSALLAIFSEEPDHAQFPGFDWRRPARSIAMMTPTHNITVSIDDPP